MTEENKITDITINANVSEATDKILSDIISIYKENYPDIEEKEIWGYVIEDMLEAYLEWSEEEDPEATDDPEEFDDDEE